MLTNVTLQKLDSLGLKGMLKALELQIKQPNINQLSFEDRLGLLIDSEAVERNSRKIDRLLTKSKLRYLEASIETIDYHPKRNLDQAIILSLSSCEWLVQKHSLIINGPTGVGKSWLACAFGKQACRNGYSVYYINATHFFEEIRNAIACGGLNKLKRFISKINLLIIDDFGIGGIDAQIGPYFLDLIDLQSISGGLLITSQIPTENWYDLFNDMTIADAVLDRIIHRANLIELKGDSMRKKRKVSDIS